MRFAVALREARGAAKVSRYDLDRALADAHGLSTGYTALLEGGRIKPPSEDVCKTIAAALEAPGLCRLAALDRIEAFGMLEFHLQEVEAAAGGAELDRLREENRQLRETLARVRTALG